MNGKIIEEEYSRLTSYHKYVTVPFLFQGQYYDRETELAYNRFRYYSPELGTYNSQDPIRLAGNNPTLYGYVSDTNIWLDVWGLSKKPKKSRLPEGNRTKTYGPSNGTLTKSNPQTGELSQIRTYDAEGNPVKDIDFGHDHGSGNHHAHDWVYPSEYAPNKTRGDGRPLNNDDLKLIEEHTKKSNKTYENK